MNDSLPLEPLVCIVLLNWNQAQDVIECLESVNKIDYFNFQVIIVDNASIDGSTDEIRLKFPEILLIRNKENLGFAAGNNVGMRKALEMGAKYVFILNSDTTVDKNIISALVETAQKDKKIGLLGCKIYYYEEPERIWFAGETRDPNTGFRKYFGKDQIDDGEYDDTVECNNITGCAMFIPAKVIMDVGGFDSDYFVYSEDIDLNMRIYRKGYKIYCVRKAKLWHKVSSALGVCSPTKAYFSVRNRLITIDTYCNKAFHFWFMLFQQFYLINVAFVKYFLSGRIHVGIAYLEGIYDFRKKRFGKGRYEGML